MKVMTQTASVADYDRIFELERHQEYPAIDAFEQSMGYAIDRAKLEGAARVLACPMKEHSPNWQHGRVLYAVARKYFASVEGLWLQVLDIGTAKGFSALCMQWALQDAQRQGHVVSTDVLDPSGTKRRNTVAECDGPKTLAQILEPWPDAKAITFVQSTGIELLERSSERIHFAFVDGKHSSDVVFQEARSLASRQVSGDVTVFDDAQIPGVRLAVDQQEQIYHLETLVAKEGREYVIARRR